MGDSVMAIGESNPRELETMKSSFLELNQELTNMTRQLHKTNIELKKLNDLKNHFLGVAAHDLRNPIGIIMGYSNFLLEELEPHLSAGQIEMLKTIQGTSEFMLHLLNELLDITAIESGKLHLELARLNLLDLIKKNVALNSIIAEMKNISIHVESFEILPEILADESKIIQVMNNLINNAIKYSNPNTRIRISLFLTGENITVAVADQGLGIPDAELGKLFKPFERTSVKGTRGEKSTGLGLSIVRNIILGHKGKIWVESKVGVGSTFYFSLPLS
jgi:signal transduction histidine kinase